MNSADILLYHRDHCFEMADVAPDPRTRRSLLRHAELFEIESRLVEKTKNCLSESRELLARVDALFAARPAPQRAEWRALTPVLREAVEQVFDKLTDKHASLAPRSASIH